MQMGKVQLAIAVELTITILVLRPSTAGQVRTGQDKTVAAYN